MSYRAPLIIADGITYRKCRRCSHTKNLSEHFRLVNRAHGLSGQLRDAWCKDCRKEYKRNDRQRALTNQRQKRLYASNKLMQTAARRRAREHYRKNRDGIADAARRKNAKEQTYLDSRMRRKFGINLKEYRAIHVAQAGLCALCGRAEATKQRRLAVDHDHATNLIRGLLCHHCNTGLGNFFDDIGLLIKAIAYLSKYVTVAEVS